MIISKELEGAIRNQLPVGWAKKLSTTTIAMIAIDWGYIVMNTKSNKIEQNYTLYGSGPEDCFALRREPDDDDE